MPGNVDYKILGKSFTLVVTEFPPWPHPHDQWFWFPTGRPTDAFYEIVQNFICFQWQYFCKNKMSFFSPLYVLVEYVSYFG